MEEALFDGLTALFLGPAETDQTNGGSESVSGVRAKTDLPDGVGSELGTALGGTKEDSAFSWARAFSQEILSDKLWAWSTSKMEQMLTLQNSQRHPRHSYGHCFGHHK